MKLENREILVTGGAGFIGSHLVRALQKMNNHVKVFDNFSTGTLINLEKTAREDLEIIEGDIRNIKDVEKACEGVEIIYHYAADPYVKESVFNPISSFNINVEGTLNILEIMREKNIKEIVFASSGGTLYGEVDEKNIPTPENVQFRPISPYGASKASCEVYLSAYSSSYGFTALTVRFANIYGPYSDHGVMFDFYHKLKENPHKLEILGNGKQIKSYMYVTDCIDATLTATKRTEKGFQAYNLGIKETSTVDEIAELVIENMNLKDVKFVYTGGEKGWTGDVKHSEISIEKLKNIGWKPKVSLKEGINKYINWLEKQN
ncbi:MAG: NAD-dependent epimerase/dehydratase family protein [Promethearchaeota archaeon]|nr:MAG: NAD-dependent epimerase/dehydratase family protein [Candidatus Lokiarchaeota archaeon]